MTAAASKPSDENSADETKKVSLAEQLGRNMRTMRNSTLWAIVSVVLTIGYFAVAVFMVNNPGIVTFPWYALAAPGLVVAALGLGSVVQDMISRE